MMRSTYKIHFPFAIKGIFEYRAVDTHWTYIPRRILRQQPVVRILQATNCRKLKSSVMSSDVLTGWRDGGAITEREPDAVLGRRRHRTSTQINKLFKHQIQSEVTLTELTFFNLTSALCLVT
jgi:hypothetical protein